MLAQRLRLRRNDEGFALVIVIAIGAILMILASVAATYSVSVLNKSKQDVAWAAAEAAAYAGIEEYQSRLATDSSYFQYGNPAAQFGAGSAVTLPTGTGQVNPAFSLDTGANSTWAVVPGSNGAAKFRYEIDTTKYLSTGIVRIRSTGLAGGVTRSIIANLKQQGFIDFLYFTDYEIQDPALSGDPVSCVKYAWAGRSSSCSVIQFSGADHIQGPVHSNDTLRICGSTFDGIVNTGNSTASGGLYYTIPAGCTAGTFNSGAPYYSPVVGVPTTNSQMKKEVRTDLPADVPNPGCLYTGATSVVLNANGTVTVRSPWTRFTRVAGDPATSGSNAAACGTPGTGAGQLGSATGATFTPPTKAVFYVQNQPASSSDPNFWPAATPAPTTCKGANGTSTGNGIGYPMSGETAPSGTPYGCTNGDVFVKGTLSGQMSIAAENYVYVTGDLQYNDSSTDMLGLVGNNAVWVWNPVNSSGTNLLTDSGRRIDAAILSVAHTFQVQNFSTGSPRGTLTVNGAIAQKFRGPVGTGSGGTTVTGYAKNYVYDARLKYTAPPKYLSPVTTTYGVTTWIDTPAAFASNGTYK
nr:hypothetical protein [Galbitalea soli]